jgi:serine/threonine protein kinase
MKLNLQIQGSPLILQDKDYLTEGGEAKIFIKGSLAYKIYHDPKDMVHPTKVKELSSLAHPNINRPIDLIYKKSIIVGYSMEALQNPIALPRLFVTDFRDKNSITSKTTLTLIKNMQETLKYIHKKNFLIVDVNENNFLIDKNFITPYFIDVCSWKTPSFPPTAITPLIQDPLNKVFSPLTDWYSFAILSCQLFVGLHPFRGSHPDFKALPAQDRVQARMKAGVSIFNPKSTYPKAIRDFSYIPKQYYDWMMSLFEKGERHCPPDNATYSIPITPTQTMKYSSQAFVIKELQTFDSPIISCSYLEDEDILLVYEGNFLNFKGIKYENKYIIFSKSKEGFIIDPTKDKISLLTLKGQLLFTLPLLSDSISIINNTLYAFTKEKMYQFALIGDILALDKIWNLLPGQTILYENILIADVLGLPYFIIPEKSECHFVPFQTLKGYKVVNAKYHNHIAIIIAQKESKNYKFIVKFSSDFRLTDVRILKDVDTLDINFTVKANGVVVHIHEDEYLEIFSNKITSPDIKVINDPQINQGMRLFSDNKICFYKDKSIYSLSMK